LGDALTKSGHGSQYDYGGSDDAADSRGGKGNPYFGNAD